MFRCRHRCRPHLLCPSPAAPVWAMPLSPNVTVADDAGLLISRLAARYAHPPAHLWPEMSPRASCQQSSGALPHRLGSSSSSTARRTLVRSDEPRVGPWPRVGRRLHPPSRPPASFLCRSRSKGKTGSRQSAAATSRRPTGRRCCRWPPHNHRTKVSRPEWYEPSGFFTFDLSD